MKQLQNIAIVPDVERRRSDERRFVVYLQFMAHNLSRNCFGATGLCDRNSNRAFLRQSAQIPSDELVQRSCMIEVRRVAAILLVLITSNCLLAGCDRSEYGGHMAGGGMTGGGMTGHMLQYDDRTLPGPQTETAQSFRRYCGQCHAPPNAAVHTMREWPRVVARMRQHMVTQRKAVPDPEQLQEIIAYLQRHAG